MECGSFARIFLCASRMQLLPVAILTIWALVVLEITDGAPSTQAGDDILATSLDADGDDKWLSDTAFYDVQFLTEEALTEDTNAPDGDLCPPVPATLPADACDVTACNTDSDCEDVLKCCYNGCIYTCSPAVHPAPHFDWLVEPRRRLQFGPSWLISGPVDNINVETCSTTPLEEDDDSDPLVCPHGYECSIDDPGSPEDGVPNRGHCVKMGDGREHDAKPTASLEKTSNIKELVKNLQADAPYKPPPAAGCMLDKTFMLISGHSTVVNDKVCECKDTKLICDDPTKTKVKGV